jgi:tRNA(Ile)-lysidine synthase
MSPLAQHLAQRLAQHHLRDAKCLLCVSGGSDSTALLHLFAEISASPARTHVLHFHHGLRPEAAQEAEFVRQQAQSLLFPFHLRQNHQLAQRTAGTQAAARQWRRAEATHLQTLLQLDVIVTAHHSDDQLETQLMKLLRGTHLSNLQGIREFDGTWFRPLLTVSKAELVSYLQTHQRSWFEDASNQQPDYTRNFLRLEVLPRLQQVTNGTLSRRFEELSRQSSALQRHLAAEHQRRFPNLQTQNTLRIAELIALDDFLCWDVLHHWLQGWTGRSVDFLQIERLTRQLRTKPADAWQLELGGHVTVFAAHGQLSCPAVVSDVIVKLPCAGVMVRCEADLRLRCWTDCATAPHPEAVWFPPLAPESPLTLRFRRDGDRFHPPWKPHSVKLKDFLRDQRVPPEQRDRLPLLCDGPDVLWIAPSWSASSCWQEPEQRAWRTGIWMRVWQEAAVPSRFVE